MAKALRLNDRIRVSPIRVIDQNEKQLGVIPCIEALNLARDAGLDLVEVSPMESPPVCRIMDYGKFKYERKKRQKLGSGGHVITLKEIRLRPKTDTHDRAIKMKRAEAFLAEGHKVQYTMLFRGRERFHKERGLGIFEEILKELGETVKLEQRAIMAGRRMTMVVSPVKVKPSGGSPKPSTKSAKPKPKPEDAAAKPVEVKPAEVSPAPEAATEATTATPTTEPAPAAPSEAPTPPAAG